MRKKIVWCAAGVLALALASRASIINYVATLVNETALAHNNAYVVNLNTNGIGTLSAQAYYSPATVANAQFRDGSQSTGTLTIASFVALSSAQATNHITVTSTSGLSGAAIVLPGYVFSNGIDWAVGNTATNTAVSIGAALATVPYLAVHVSGNVVYATAPAGSYYNSIGLISNNAGLVVATPMFAGGQDNAVVQINGVPLRQGNQWTAATSNAATATSLANAINSASALSHIKAQAVSSAVNLTSVLNGAVYNYRLQSSSPSALSTSGAFMINGTDPNLVLGSPVFTSTATNGLTTALAVLYTGSPAIGGLSSGSTYYAVPTTGNSFMLAKYSTSAVAGNVDLVVVTSTHTGLTSNAYTLAPLATTGNSSFKWQVSNDNINWNDLAVSSVTVQPNDAPNTTLWSFGFIGTQYLRLAAVAPATGGLQLKVLLIGTN